MADEKKIVAENKEATPVSGDSTTPKKKSKTLWYIIGGVIFILILIPVLAFLLIGGVIKKGVDLVEDNVDNYEVVVEEETGEEESDTESTEEGDEETWQMKKSTEEAVDGDLEKEDLITDEFPEDIPLPGGIVTGSSYDDSSIDLKIDIDSTVEEIMDWYVEALEEEGWEITSRSSEEPMEGYFAGEIEFAKEEEERRGTIDMEKNPFIQVTSIKIRELLW